MKPYCSDKIDYLSICSLSPFPRQLSRNEKLSAAAPPIISGDLFQLQISIDNGIEYWWGEYSSRPLNSQVIESQKFYLALSAV